MTQSTETAFSIVAETQVGALYHKSEPIPVPDAGINLVAEVLREGGTVRFRVMASAPLQPGVATLQKICLEPVRFMLSHNGAPLQELTLTGNDQVGSIDLTS